MSETLLQPRLRVLDGSCDAGLVQSRRLQVAEADRGGIVKLQWHPAHADAPAQLARVLGADRLEPGRISVTAGPAAPDGRGGEEARPAMADLLTSGAQAAVAWVGPSECWIFCARAERALPLVDLLEGTGAARWFAHEVSDSNVLVSVSGAACEDYLSKSCALDFHHSAFSVGAVAVTRFAQLSVMIARVRDDGFLLLADASHAAWLARWLCDAAREFED